MFVPARFYQFLVYTGNTAVAEASTAIYIPLIASTFFSLYICFTFLVSRLRLTGTLIFSKPQFLLIMKYTHTHQSGSYALLPLRYCA